MQTIVFAAESQAMLLCCRILVKVIPQSINNIKSCDESGGGNRISEDQIKHYLTFTLGDAPQPRWGVPNGWGSYLAGETMPRQNPPLQSLPPSQPETCFCKALLECVKTLQMAEGNYNADPPVLYACCEVS